MCSAGLPALLIAQAPGPTVSVPVDSPAFWGVLLMVGLPTLVAAINGVLQIVKFFRPDPPTHQVYAEKSWVTKIEDQLNHKASRSELGSLESRINSSVARIGHDLERLEEKADEHADKSDRYRESLAKELHAIGRQMSEVYGMLKKKV